MAKFKGIVQIYKEFHVEAINQEEAKAKINGEVVKIILPTDRYTINEPKNLDKAAKKRLEKDKIKHAKL